MNLESGVESLSASTCSFRCAGAQCVEGFDLLWPISLHKSFYFVVFGFSSMASCLCLVRGK